MKKIFLILLLLPSLAWGQSMGVQGDSTEVTVTNTSKGIDSATVEYYWGSTRHDSITVLPQSGTNHNTCVRTQILSLDSIGTYRVEIYMYNADAIDDSLFGTHTNSFNLTVAMSRIDSTLTSLGYATVKVQSKLGTMIGTGGDDAKSYFTSLNADVFNIDGWNPASDSILLGELIFNKLDSIALSLGFALVPVHDKFGTMTGLGGDDIKSYFTSYLNNFDPALDTVAFVDTVLKDVGASASLSAETEAQIDSILESLGYASVTAQDKFGTMTGLGGDDIKTYFTNYLNNFDPALDTVAFVDSLIESISGASGSGANLCSLYAVGGGVGLSGANIRMQASGGANYYNSTNTDGLTTFSLDDGTYSAYGFLINYNQDTIPQTFAITSDSTDTITFTAYVVGSPSSVSLTRLYAYSWNVGGDSLGQVIMTATPKGRGTWIDSLGATILLDDQIAVSNDTGYVYLDLYKSHYVTNAKGDSLKYDITLQKQGSSSADYKNIIIYGDSTTQWLRRW